MVPDTDPETLNIVAERIRKSIESEVFEYEGTKIQVTISVGGAIYCSQHNPVRLDVLFQKADEALYLAKKNGRNQYQLDVSPPGSVPVLPAAPNTNVSMSDHKVN
jgi:diguanylate cyclase (GGDEF)-like protein